MKNKLKAGLTSLLIFSAYRIYSSDFFAEFLSEEQYTSAGLLKLLFPYSLVNCIAFAFLFVFLLENSHKFCNSRWEKIVSAVFSFGFVAGNVAATVGAFAEKLYSKTILLFVAIFYIGFYLAFKIVFYYLRTLTNFIKNTHLDCFFDTKKQYWIVAIILFICWVPYIILRYPAGFEYDAYFQTADFIEGTLTAHWPPASSAWMGGFVLIGQKLFNSPDIGIFLYCIIQLIIGSLIFSYITVAMRRLNVPVMWVYISIVIFALIPVYPGYIGSVVKDAPYAYMVALYVTILAEYIELGINRSKLVGITISGLLMSILRNNGIFIIGAIFGVSILAFFIKKQKIYMALIAVSLVQIVCIILYSSALLPALGIQSTSEAEALSVPFQQTARLAHLYPEEISEEEADIINTVLDFKTITDEYNPELSDPVKATYHSDNKSDFGKYILVWLKQGLKRPDVYIDAFLLNSIGFIYPDVRMWNSPVVSGVYSQVYNSRSVQFDVDWGQILKREEFKDNISFIENLPIVFPFVNTAISLWIVLILFAWAMNKKDLNLIVILIPSIIGALVCLASPTYMNNGARYAIPIIYTNMFLIGLCMGQHQNLMSDKQSDIKN